jgi:hypothetical protein
LFRPQTVIQLVNHLAGPMSPFQVAVWSLYLLAAVMLPIYHVRPILKYLRGNSGIGDACIRTEAIQCLWRVPALMFSVFVAPSLPLFLSIFLDMLGRIGRVLAMRSSKRRWVMAQSVAGTRGASLASPGAAPATASDERDAPPGLPRNARATPLCAQSASAVPKHRFALAKPFRPHPGPAALKQRRRPLDI